MVSSVCRCGHDGIEPMPWHGRHARSPNMAPLTEHKAQVGTYGAVLQE